MIQMNPQLREDILNAVRSDGKVKQDASGKYLQKIACPSCHKAEAFISVDAPWMIKCGRENKCGAAHHVKEVYPEFFETWTERYEPKTDQAKQENPTAVADGYLRDGRGFDLLKIRGWYTQDNFFSNKLGLGSTTVRFMLPQGYWERILDKPQRFGSQKANFVGPYKGHVWMPPTTSYADLAKANEIWVVEGIFDAIALHHVGITAVSNMSSANYPNIFLQEIQKAAAQGKRPRIIWAQDGNRAGHKAIKKFSKLAGDNGWQCGAAQPPEGKPYDWNDLLQRGQLDDWHIDKYLHWGDLLLAGTASEKALLMYNNRESREFWFTFENQLYWWKLDMDAYDKAVRSYGTREGSEQITDKQREAALKSSGCVAKICTAMPRPLYFQANHITDESWYYFSIETPDGTIEKKPFTPKQLTSANEFKNRLLAIKNSWWTGTPKQLDRVMQDMMHNLKTVETVDFIGFCDVHRAYIFGDIAVRDSRIVEVNEEDFFQFGKLAIKSLSSQPELVINPNDKEYQREWAGHLLTAFDKAGVIATAYWIGSLFAQQVRELQQSYPFFELVGEAGAGKSTLLEFLWKLCGRADWEGLDPNKMTPAARGRYFSQVSNLPIVLIESDREDASAAKQFDWDELKPAFNGRAMRSRGVKNNGNDTYEPPMRGAVVISQNAKVEASEAIMSRILHVRVTREHHNTHSKKSSDWLARCPVENLSGFILDVIKNEKKLLALFDERQGIYEQQLTNIPELRMVRIVKNHAQLLALIDCLGDDGLKVFNEQQLTPVRDYVLEMAKERQGSINSDHPMVVEFWEAYDFIQSRTTDNKLNHLGNDDSAGIAINLKEFESWCGDYKLRTPPIRELKPFLATSKNRKFTHANKVIASKIKESGSRRCWVFEGEKS